MRRHLRGPALGWLLAVAALTASAEAGSRPILAVIPFANYAEDSLARPVVMPRVYSALAERNIHHVSEADIRPVLRRHRIRSVGQIGLDGARVIVEASGARAILMGSIDVFDAESSLEVAISARIMEMESFVIARAASASAHYLDLAGPFGTGGVDSVGALVDHVMGKIIDQLGEWPDEARGYRPRNRVKIAVVPFDSAVDYENAGDIASVRLVRSLIQGGYDVIEPGVVAELALAHTGGARGMVDYPILSALDTEFETDLVVTGTVETFQRSRGGDASPAVIEISARILDAATRRLIAGFHDTRDGHDSEKLFGQGRSHSVCQLAGEVMDTFLGAIDRESEAFAWTRAGASAPQD